MSSIELQPLPDEFIQLVIENDKKTISGSKEKDLPKSVGLGVPYYRSITNAILDFQRAINSVKWKQWTQDCF